MNSSARVAPPGHVDARGRELLGLPAEAEPGVEAAVGHDVEAGQCLRQDERGVERQVHHRQTEPHAARCRREERRDDQRVVNAAVRRRESGLFGASGYRIRE